MSRIRAIVAALALLAGVSLVGACSEGSVFNLAIGDCFNDPDTTAEEVSSVEMVDCTEAHDNEVYAEGTMTEDVYPGEDTIVAFAEETCLAAFESYVGIPFDQSALYYWYYIPTAESWSESNDRLVTCMLYNPEMQTTGTFKGSGI